jgi:protein-L-isoaspartate(D-aspartate) O-methyltransferase
MKKQEMFDSISTYLSCFGSFDKKILDAIDKIDRKEFMPPRLKSNAYVDSAMPIAKGQTISQPSTVARMLSLLKLKKGDDVLEIGTGSGWNASLIAFLVAPGKVLSLELHKELIETAKKKIQKFNLKNLAIEKKDFRKLKARFDKIIFTAGITQNQENLITHFAEKHLKENGILVCPFQSGPLIIIKKTKKAIKKTYTKEEYVFVPLLG